MRNTARQIAVKARLRQREFYERLATALKSYPRRAYRNDGRLAKSLLSADPEDERRNQQNSNDEKSDALWLFDRCPAAGDCAEIYIS